MHHETRLLNSIENNTDYTESFKDLTKAYNSYTKRLENRTRTRLTKLQCLNRLQTYNPIDYDILLGGDPKGSTKEAREEANRLQDYLQSTSYSLATKKSYIKAVKLLSRCMMKDPESGKWVEDTEMLSEGAVYPRSTRWLKQTIPAKAIRKTPEETLTQDEIDRIIEQLPLASFDRSFALIQLCRNVGLRGGELLALKYSSFEFKNGIAVAVNVPKEIKEIGWIAKTGSRSLPLSVAQVPVTKWLEKLKASSSLEDPWFCSHVFTFEPVSMTALFDPIKDAAKRAKISESKRIHSLGFRSATASHLYNSGVPTQDIKKFMGWGMTSTMVDQYVVESTDNLARSVNAAFGATDMVEAPRGIEMVKCYNCNQQTPNTSDHARCQHCYVQLVPVNRQESEAEFMQRVATATAIATAEALETEMQNLKEGAKVTGDYYNTHSDFS